MVAMQTDRLFHLAIAQKLPLEFAWLQPEIGFYFCVMSTINKPRRDIIFAAAIFPRAHLSIADTCLYFWRSAVSPSLGVTIAAAADMTAETPSKARPCRVADCVRSAATIFNWAPGAFGIPPCTPFKNMILIHRVFRIQAILFENLAPDFKHLAYDEQDHLHNAGIQICWPWSWNWEACSMMAWKYRQMSWSMSSRHWSPYQHGLCLSHISDKRLNFPALCKQLGDHPASHTSCSSRNKDPTTRRSFYNARLISLKQYNPLKSNLHH